MHTIKFVSFVAGFITVVASSVLLVLVIIALATDSYGTVTPGGEIEVAGRQCQVFHHERGPDQAICFRNDGPVKVFGFELWDATVPEFVMEEGVCTPIYGPCP